MLQIICYKNGDRYTLYNTFFFFLSIFFFEQNVYNSNTNNNENWFQALQNILYFVTRNYVAKSSTLICLLILKSLKITKQIFYILLSSNICRRGNVLFLYGIETLSCATRKYWHPLHLIRLGYTKWFCERNRPILHCSLKVELNWFFKCQDSMFHRQLPTLQWKIVFTFSPEKINKM